MRIAATVVGIGERKQGEAKRTKKPYDFTDLSLVYYKKGVAGEFAETIPCDQEILEGHNIVVGEPIEIVCHQYNFRTFIDAII